MIDQRVRCLPPELSQGGNEKLRFEVNGRNHALSLQLRGFNRLMLRSLPDRAMDLLEIAALVYGLDAAVSRGGLMDRQMGAKWYRTFQVTMPVRDLEAWLAKDVTEDLTETLHALSGDRFFFNFVKAPDQRVESGWLDLGNEDVWQADRVLMFSGGLDSFAGALEEIADHGHKVALVSHQSSNTIGKVQSDLVAHLRTHFGSEACRHFPLKAQLTQGSNLEGTHRTRSFLFAAIGQVTAMAFDLNRVSFHENGVVSLNLPPVKSVVGTKATRTTHPQILPRVSGLFAKVFNEETRVDNPFFWRTKTEVLETIARLGASEQIAVTSSCADTRNRTNQHPHCGRCSQCIDRRFAVLAAGLAQEDPAEAYAVDLIEGVREDVRDREMGLSYMRNAAIFETISPQGLLAKWPEILSSVEHFERPRAAALKDVCALLNRHGTAVTGVIRDHMGSGHGVQNTLAALFGQMMMHSLWDPMAFPGEPHDQATVLLTLHIELGRGHVTIDDKVVLKKSATTRVLIALARLNLDGAGQGLDPLDYPCAHPIDLAEALGLESDEGVRQSVKRARTTIKNRLVSAGYDGDAAEIIENIHGLGYRLDPEKVIVRMHGS